MPILLVEVTVGVNQDRARVRKRWAVVGLGALACLAPATVAGAAPAPRQPICIEVPKLPGEAPKLCLDTPTRQDLEDTATNATGGASPAPSPAPPVIPAPTNANALPAPSTPAPAAPAAAPARADAREEQLEPVSIETRSVSEAVRRTTRTFTPLLVLASALVIFLVFHGRLAQRDPKLVAAPLDREFMEFG